MLRIIPLFVLNLDFGSDPRNQQLDGGLAWVERLTYSEDDCIKSAVMVNKVELSA